MKEALVRCKSSIRIADLDRGLEAGTEYWFDEDEAKGSKDLLHAARIGAITLHYVERYRTMRKPLPPFPRLSRGGNIRKPSPASKPASKSIPKEPANLEKAEVQVQVNLDVQEVVRQITDSLSETVKGMVERALGEKAEKDDEGSSSPSFSKEDLTEAMALAIRKAGVSVGNSGTSQGGSGSSSVYSEEPVYIPSNLVSKSEKGAIETKTEVSTSSNVDDAAAALKALRKRKK